MPHAKLLVVVQHYHENLLLNAQVGTIIAAVMTFVTGFNKDNPMQQTTLALRDTGAGEVEMTAEDGEFKEDEFVVQVLAFTI